MDTKKVGALLDELGFDRSRGHDEVLREALEELQETRALFDKQHTRVIEADHLWQKAHNSDVFPDLGALVEWLMQRADVAEARVKELEARGQ